MLTFFYKQVLEWFFVVGSNIDPTQIQVVLCCTLTRFKDSLEEVVSVQLQTGSEAVCSWWERDPFTRFYSIVNQNNLTGTFYRKLCLFSRSCFRLTNQWERWTFSRGFQRFTWIHLRVIRKQQNASLIHKFKPERANYSLENTWPTVWSGNVAQYTRFIKVCMHFCNTVTLHEEMADWANTQCVILQKKKKAQLDVLLMFLQRYPEIKLVAD